MENQQARLPGVWSELAQGGPRGGGFVPLKLSSLDRPPVGKARKLGLRPSQRGNSLKAHGPPRLGPLPPKDGAAFDFYKEMPKRMISSTS